MAILHFKLHGPQLGVSALQRYEYLVADLPHFSRGQVERVESGNLLGFAEGGIGCGDCVFTKPLRVEIEHLTLIDRGPSPEVEWTIRVTNQTKRPIQLPSSLSWSGPAASVNSGRSKLQQIYFGETAECGPTGDRLTSKHHAVASMYAPADGARDVVTLDAGQWVTVMGNGAACGFPRAGSDSYAVSVELAQVEWYREKEEDRENSRSVYSKISSQPVKWDGTHDFVKAETAKADQAQ